MHEAFVTAGSSHRGPVFVDVPMDELFNTASGPLPDVTSAARRRAGPRRAHARSPSCSPPPRGRCWCSGTDVWADARRGGRAAARRDGRGPRDHQRHGPRHRPRRPPAAGHQGPRPGARGRRPGRRRRHAPGLPAGLRRASAGGRPAQVVHVADSPGQVSAHADPRRLALRRPHRGLRRAPRRAGAGRPAPRLGAWVARPAGRGGRRRRARRRPCSPPRPTRSTRPGSTASWCRGWPTTRS